jgi:hypothetical protein
MALAQTDLPTRAMQILARLPGVALRGSPLSPASRRSGRTRASLGLRSPPGVPSLRDVSARSGDFLPRAWSASMQAPNPGPAPRSVDRGEPRNSPKRASPPGVSPSRQAGCRCRTGLNDLVNTLVPGGGSKKTAETGKIPGFANRKSRPLRRLRSRRCEAFAQPQRVSHVTWILLWRTRRWNRGDA